MTALRLAIAGFGKIARDQHVPAIAATEGLTLVATASPQGSFPGVPHFATLDDLLRGGPPVDAVAICTPPQVRSRLAAAALAAGKHVMLEKPPGASLGEVEPLTAMAERQRRSLFAAWHSRHAAAVEPARSWLASRRIRSVHVEWKEDVRVWHPGQSWIFEPGGLGVFDPGINALSILTRILPEPVFVAAAELCFPANREAPIAATLSLTGTKTETESSVMMSNGGHARFRARADCGHTRELRPHTSARSIGAAGGLPPDARLADAASGSAH